MPTETTARAGPFSLAAGGLRVALRVQPGASRAQIDGLADLGEDVTALRVRVTEPAEGGRANAAVIKLLAKSWRLPKGSLEVVAGRSERRKLLFVAGEPGPLRARLERWLATLPQPEARKR